MAPDSSRPFEAEEAWEDAIGAAARVHRVTANEISGAATYRFASDDEHIARLISERYDEIVSRIAAEAAWPVSGLKPPVMILRNLAGVQTGIRDFARSAPLEMTTYHTDYGDVVLPTPAEMLRIKGYLFVRRNALRDIVDFLALSDRLSELEGREAILAALRPLDKLYPQRNGQSVTRQLAKQLADPKPYDREDATANSGRALNIRYGSWGAVCEKALTLAAEIERHRLRTGL